MSGFTSIFGSSGAAKDSAPGALSTSTSSAGNAEIKKKLQQQISQELAVANATELVNVSRVVRGEQAQEKN
ncbi:Tim13p [Sugiyamaella lignohabitans]|uniref:Tim13p n=1 Tax=Sugiyamaella lignohabitans TaxID=796027 RepID=A0A167DCN8_9ASCO|nr:Tim13p [Sugiyamaella lignohabitans]ANB12765.1 Tim13p [Sugiyamaella lignohabitans]